MINSGQGQRPPLGGVQGPPIGGAARPATGTGAGAAARPAVGAAARPAVGTAARPAVGTTARPAVGTVARPAMGAARPAGSGVGAARPMAGGTSAANGQKVTVGIADMKILQWDGELITYALGSCIGICLWDPNIKLGALIHIMLPINMEAGRKNTMKYADTGIKETINQLVGRGARKDRLVAKIAGGAKMFEVVGPSNLGNIGERNIESVRMNLRKEGIRIISDNVGGSVARTLSFYPATGIGEIRAYGQPVITL